MVSPDHMSPVKIICQLALRANWQMITSDSFGHCTWSPQEIMSFTIKIALGSAPDQKWLIMDPNSDMKLLITELNQDSEIDNQEFRIWILS